MASINAAPIVATTVNINHYRVINTERVKDPSGYWWTNNHPHHGTGACQARYGGKPFGAEVFSEERCPNRDKPTDSETKNDSEQNH